VWAVGHHHGVRGSPGLLDRRGCSHRAHVYLQRQQLHGGRYGLPRRPDRGHLRKGRQRLFLSRLDIAVHDADVMLGRGADRGLRPLLHQQLHPGSNVVRRRRSCHMHPREQRLLGLRGTGGLWVSPDLHRSGRRRGLHVQRRPCVHYRRTDVCELYVACNLLDRRAGLRVRVRRFYVHELRRGSLLHELVRPGSNHVRWKRARDVHARQQRLLGLRHARCLRRSTSELLGSRGGCDLRVHRKSLLHHGPYGRPERVVRGQHDARGLLDRRAGLPVRNRHSALHERGLLLWVVLHERVHRRRTKMRTAGDRDVLRRGRRLLGIRRHEPQRVRLAGHVNALSEAACPRHLYSPATWAIGPHCSILRFSMVSWRNETRSRCRELLGRWRENPLGTWSRESRGSCHRASRVRAMA
jgi:hypothetical protein